MQCKGEARWSRVAGEPGCIRESRGRRLKQQANQKAESENVFLFHDWILDGRETRQDSRNPSGKRKEDDLQNVESRTA